MLDLLALLPLEIMYIWFGTRATLLRINRLLKFGDFLEFFKRLGKSFTIES